MKWPQPPPKVEDSSAPMISVIVCLLAPPTCCSCYGARAAPYLCCPSSPPPSPFFSSSSPSFTLTNSLTLVPLFLLRLKLWDFTVSQPAVFFLHFLLFSLFTSTWLIFTLVPVLCSWLRIRGICVQALSSSHCAQCVLLLVVFVLLPD